MNKGPNATIRLVRRQNHAGTTVSWTTVQREKNSHAYKLSSNVQTACSTNSLNNCPKHSILRFSSFALKIYLWLKMCQHNLPCSIVLPTACFPEGPSPHFTLCSFWRRRPRLEAVLCVTFCCRTNKEWYDRGLGRSISDILYWLAAHCLNEISIWPKLYKKSFKGFRRYGVDTKFKGKAYDLELWPWPWVFVAEWWVLHTVSLRGTFEWSIMKLVQTV